MCIDPRARRRHSRQRGLTFIELIFFIIIVTVGLSSILLVLDQASGRSADPMVNKQMLAVAESVLEEVRLQAHSWCDPDDPNAATATSAAGCTGGAGGTNDQLTTAPTAGETRGSTTSPWDHVMDYNGAVITTSLAGTAFPAGYAANVQVLQEALGPAGAPVPAGAAVRIRVSVTFGADTMVLEGYRTRYAPNALP
jgi:MSHA pilin protein MshD